MLSGRVVSAVSRRVAPQAVALRSIASSVPCRGGSHDDGTVAPPFQRLPLAQAPLPEESELVIDDAVAPEAALDFDAPHVPTKEGVAWWLGGFAFFFMLYQAAKSTDPPSKKKTVRRYDHLPEATKDAMGRYIEAGEQRETPLRVIR